MGIINRKTGERRLVGKIIGERGTFRMDQAQDEIRYWDDETNSPKITYIGQCDWYLETSGPDLDKETEAKYEKYLSDHRAYVEKYTECNELTEGKIGSRVIVFKGRKIEHGTSGTIIGKNFSNYGLSFLIKEESGKTVWIAASNCLIEINGIWFKA